MIFRDNVRPEWEDKLNATGGHFQFQLKPNVGGGQAGYVEYCWPSFGDPSTPADCRHKTCRSGVVFRGFSWRSLQEVDRSGPLKMRTAS